MSHHTIFIKPWIEAGKIIGWTWELLAGPKGKVAATGSTPRESIDLARQEALARTKTYSYPGSYVEWDRFWNDNLNGGGEVDGRDRSA